MVTTKDIMRKNVVTADPNTTLYQISKILTNNKIGSVIITEKKKPIGIITERDIVNAVANKKNLEKLKANDLKKKKLVVISPMENILNATRIMVKNGYKRLPVVDKGNLVGILSEKEILISAPEMVELMSEKLKFRMDMVTDTYKELSGICEDCSNYSNNLKHITGRWYCEDCRN